MDRHSWALDTEYLQSIILYLCLKYTEESSDLARLGHWVQNRGIEKVNYLWTLFSPVFCLCPVWNDWCAELTYKKKNVCLSCGFIFGNWTAIPHSLSHVHTSPVPPPVCVSFFCFTMKFLVCAPVFLGLLIMLSYFRRRCSAGVLEDL